MEGLLLLHSHVLNNVVLNTDEQALVNAARSLGIVFESRTPDTITIDVVGTVGVVWDQKME